MTNITTLTNIALAKVILKQHACLQGYIAFEMNVYEDAGTFTLSFTAKQDNMESHAMFTVDIHATTSEAEMTEWLANTRVSTRYINTVIANADKAEEAATELAKEVEAFAIEVGQATTEQATSYNGQPFLYTRWTAAAEPFFVQWATDVLDFGNCNFRLATFPRINAYRKAFEKARKGSF